MIDENKPKKFCPSCGENVDTFVVERGPKLETSKPIEQECCIFCGMLVVEIPGDKLTPVDTILVADDSAMIRALLKDVITDNKLASNVVTCDHGADFITVFTRKLIEKNPAALIVLDVAMPILNGVNAAIAARAIEKCFAQKPTPIMFFTAQKCDENFKKVLSFCKPALYLNKASSSTPDELSSRIGKVVKHLMKET